MEDILFSVLIGAIPTSSMLFASLALINLKVPPLIEACFQNFCAGLILAAVALELLPLMGPSQITSPFNSVVGTTLGFMLGVFMINAIDQVIDSFEDDKEQCNEYVQIPKCDVSSQKYLAMREMEKRNTSQSTIVPLDTGIKSMRDLLPWNAPSARTEQQMEMKATPSDNESSKMLSDSQGRRASLKSSYGMLLSPQMGRDGVKDIDSDLEGCTKDGYDHESILYAAIAIASPKHRDHIQEHFMAILTDICVLEKSALCLMSQGEDSLRQSEKMAEEIDERIHMLQYRLDHSRRLLEGSESDISAAIQQNNELKRKSDDNPSWWTAPEKKTKLEECLGSLKYMAQHLLEHMTNKKSITIPILREIHGHIGDLDNQLSILHKATEDASFIWRRLTRVMGMPAKGSFVPLSLIVPVAIDSFVDGFLIGVACSLSKRAGWILAMANCLEMAFLGMAVSIRVNKCTGSSKFVRYSCITVPPFIMLGATVLGSFAGTISKGYPLIFVTFVAFGVIALLYLVFNELLVEARDAQEGNVQWWVTAVVFVGFYVVLMMDLAMA
eukprot:CAMPEP_0119036262 /NCGR_PEP_ID=MMETSP1177-20130426/3847_1 /TAXON_ID=2985 /ORGANISM="Ochromonas sp, Strain CCMP1899" /LENGTH=554 /DNA_ID=CAMNT_0006995841 /DNA_START=152 /DNA_END=1816 /DNA_ORIENTATION=-